MSSVSEDAHVAEFAKQCTRLRFIWILDQSWQVRRSALDGVIDIALEPLDDWEDQVECLDVFSSPYPLAWSGYVRHAEYLASR